MQMVTNNMPAFLNLFVETMIEHFQDSKEQHLFEIETFHNIKKVFTVTLL